MRTAVPHHAAPEMTEMRSSPRFGGVLWRMVRTTNSIALPLAGKRWNPIFAIVEHVGRRSGRTYATPVAARRDEQGFVVALAFGAHVDWYRNLVAAGGGVIRWRAADYPMAAPQHVPPADALAAFLPIQRFFLGLARIDGYVRLADRAGEGVTR